MNFRNGFTLSGVAPAVRQRLRLCKPAILECVLGRKYFLHKTQRSLIRFALLLCQSCNRANIWLVMGLFDRRSISAFTTLGKQVARLAVNSCYELCRKMPIMCTNFDFVFKIVRETCLSLMAPVLLLHNFVT